MVKSIAMCAGSGGSMLKDVNADVYFTGEMPHVRCRLSSVTPDHIFVISTRFWPLLQKGQT